MDKVKKRNVKCNVYFNDTKSPRGLILNFNFFSVNL